MDLIGKDSKAITKYKTRVLSDDKDNAEAKAAREYWKVLFEEDFVRKGLAIGQTLRLITPMPYSGL